MMIPSHAFPPPYPDESHNLYMDLGSIVGSLDILEFMVWELVAGTTNSPGYYIENGISKRYCDGVDIICRHLIGYVSVLLTPYVNHINAPPAGATDDGNAPSEGSRS